MAGYKICTGCSSRIITTSSSGVSIGGGKFNGSMQDSRCVVCFVHVAVVVICTSIVVVLCFVHVAVVVICTSICIVVVEVCFVHVAADATTDFLVVIL